MISHCDCHVAIADCILPFFTTLIAITLTESYSGCMEQASSTQPPLARFLRKLVAYLSQDWLIALLDLYQFVCHFFAQRQLSGIYEILAYDSALELLDAKGRVAVFKRHQKVKFLQNHITVFQDHAWGDGNIFADYKCSPGLVVDRYQEGDRWNILISLRETKSKGDITDFYIERTVKNGFTNDEEWWQVEVWDKTDRLLLSLIFPATRHCQRAVLQTRGGNKTVVLDHQHFHRLPDGRQLIQWEANNLSPAEVYTLRWQW